MFFTILINVRNSKFHKIPFTKIVKIICDAVLEKLNGPVKKNTKSSSIGFLWLPKEIRNGEINKTNKKYNNAPIKIKTMFFFIKLVFYTLLLQPCNYCLN